MRGVFEPELKQVEEDENRVPTTAAEGVEDGERGRWRVEPFIAGQRRGHLIMS